jgi:hypothetical protein
MEWALGGTRRQWAAVGGAREARAVVAEAKADE